jgi:hypothetical protein
MRGNRIRNTNIIFLQSVAFLVHENLIDLVRFCILIQKVHTRNISIALILHDGKLNR